MKILIDIGHPAHVHYFRNFINIMKQKGHDFLITSRDKEVTFKLLTYYKIPFYSRGKGGKGIIGKLIYIFKGDWILFKQAKKFKPDLFLSFASPYASHVAFFIGKPHIAFDDTEAAKFGQFFYFPFTRTILNPQSYKKEIKGKQIRFNGFMELCSLHPNYFSPDETILKTLITYNKPYILIRLVSWNANHDFGQSGITPTQLKTLVERYKDQYSIYISSEGQLSDEFKPFQVKVSPEYIHQLMAFATLFIGEGATMASECAMMGIPALYVNTITAGTIEEQVKLELLYSFRDSNGVLESAEELLSTPNLKEQFQLRRKKMLVDKIDVTAFMVWFIENYPESRKTMKENPDYQYNFR